MILKIVHKIAYQYSRPVFLEPAAIRLKPRSDSFQQLLSYQLSVDPAPEGLTESVDIEDSPTTYIYFSGEHSRLQMESRSEVRTLRANPFDFILPHEKYSTLPFAYPEPWKDVLQPYLRQRFSSAELEAFTHEVLKMAKGDTFQFITTLTQQIPREISYQPRKEGKPMNPLEVLQEKVGSCRDVTLLFMEVCRSVGLASRYVSGYSGGNHESAQGDLHAWAEVYLPGGGWRGFDPSMGLAVADNHVALASSCEPELTLPTSGTFRGTGVKSKFDYEVNISVLSR
jgi:transglutaminase-like putative cysteine protease